jgi:hypothetical protein
MALLGTSRVSANGERDLRISDTAGAIPAAALRLRPYRFDGCRIGSRSADPSNRARSFRRRIAGPSRRGRARPDAGIPCTRRSAGRGQRQRCRASAWRVLHRPAGTFPFDMKLRHQILLGASSRFSFSPTIRTVSTRPSVRVSRSARCTSVCNFTASSE